MFVRKGVCSDQVREGAKGAREVRDAERCNEERNEESCRRGFVVGLNMCALSVNCGGEVR
jgi:hypothetical protein